MILTIIPPTLPQLCLDDTFDLQALINYAFENAQVSVSGVESEFVRSETEPGPEDRDKTWVRLRADDGAIDKLYNYIDGQWVSRHPIDPGDGRRILYVGSEASIASLDGGASGTVGDASGPMWQIDTVFAARFPVGVGTFPLSTTAVAVNGTGGVDQVTLALENLPAEPVDVLTDIVGQSSVGSDVPVVGNAYGSEPVSGSGRAVDSTSDEFAARYKTKGRIEELGEGEPVSALPPYIGVYFLKRTTRLYYIPS